MAKPLRVFLEVGKRKVFASAADWPGWCRAGATEEAALETLVRYAPRFAVVAGQAGLAFPSSVRSWEIVERLPGDATTDFGAPGVQAAAEALPVTAAAAKRLAALVVAAWAVFDDIATTTPEHLRKGPRGGGRDRDKIIEHVLGSEAAYARKLGLQLPAPAIDDIIAVEFQREAIAAVIGVASDGGPLVPKGWTTRYCARRIAWHALDHAWEMQDRTES